MIKFQPCCECEHVTVCKHNENYNAEIEVLMATQATFTTADIEVKCQYFKKMVQTPRTPMFGR